MVVPVVDLMRLLLISRLIIGIRKSCISYLVKLTGTLNVENRIKCLHINYIPCGKAVEYKRKTVGFPYDNLDSLWIYG